MTYRRIPHATPPEHLRPSHPTPVRRGENYALRECRDVCSLA